ncbi:NAD(P)-dependent oxidoreductase [Micromonospora sp. PLK6-60]|uniref:NAD(P)-dependent oxidoreductase n=1 Tax=Micromonospora sp. PLK6-60 TaxID=2873383 RepID=UPI001CA65638|nr:NAD(P)-dependent oxidoreductase [Micromonospora sp. PLK6-60]MBY8873290.1 NAD(P)-dependent oxidoreductase [Micromonospora sp. PLK6-60]
MSDDHRRLRVAFLGLGRMGTPMARHVLTAGHDLTVWNRSPGKAEPLAAAGASVAGTPAEAAADRDVVVLMLAAPDAVERVLFGPDGVASGAAPGTLVVDGSTIGPDASRRMAERLRGQHLRYVDAPVYGSVGPATEGTLGVLAGGADDDVAAARPLLELWGDPKQVRHVGPTGAGSAAKLVRNLTLGLALAGIGDALRLAATLELPGDVVDELIAAGPLGAAFPGVRQILAAGPPETANFTVDMLTKDLRLCLAAEPRLPLVDAARAVGEAAHADGHGQDDTRALPLWMRDAQR